MKKEGGQNAFAFCHTLFFCKEKRASQVTKLETLFRCNPVGYLFISFVDSLYHFQCTVARNFTNVPARNPSPFARWLWRYVSVGGDDFSRYR